MNTITIEYDDGSHISFFEVPDDVADTIADEYLHNYNFSHKV